MTSSTTSPIRHGVRRLLAAAIFIAGGTVAQLPADYDAGWSALPSGGGTASSESYAIKATIGQAAAGVSASANYRVEAGFLAGFAAATEPSGPGGNVWMVW